MKRLLTRVKTLDIVENLKGSVVNHLIRRETIIKSGSGIWIRKAGII